MFHCSLIRIKLAFDTKYKTVALTLLTYLVVWPWPQRPLVLAWISKITNVSLKCCHQTHPCHEYVKFRSKTNISSHMTK